MQIQNDIQTGSYPIKQDLRTPAESGCQTGYQLELSAKETDLEWDSFLLETPGGHHVQTSLWAQVKASLGWQAKRLVVRQAGQIVAGAQILFRTWPLFGALGYVTKGPVFTIQDPDLISLVVEGLKDIARAYRIQCLVVQGPDNGQSVAQALPGHHFSLSPMEMGVTATVKLDLKPGLDQILAQMKSKRRYNIRLGQRKGLTVREGTAADLEAFHQSLLATGQRQDFTAYPKSYFYKMWEVFEPRGHIKLFLTEYQNQVISSLLAIPFGDTVIYKKGTWNGTHGQLRPNEVMHWHAIQWAKSQNYAFYDFEGIDRQAAEQLLAGEALPATEQQTPARFKLGFGGQVMLFPQAYDYVYNPLLRWGHQTVINKIAPHPAAERLLEVLKTR